jgi:tRNA-modifying protein YgfZ
MKNPFMSKNPFFTLLHDEALIEARGTDSISFLQGQLTNDVALLEDQSVQLSGYCNVKGRLYATFNVIKYGSDVDLIVPSDIAAALTKRLSMFVMRAKTKLTLIEQARFVGLFSPTPDLVGESAAIAVNQSVQLSHPSDPTLIATLLRLPNFSEANLQIAAQTRYVLVTNETNLSAWVDHFSTSLTQGSLSDWRAAEINAGMTRVGHTLTEMFVPQMLNLELLGAVNFKKGCYPGQEVVARSQYLGKMKRRTFLFSSNAPVSAFTMASDVVNAATLAVEGQVVGIAQGDNPTTSHLLIETSTDIFAACQSGDIALKLAEAVLAPLPQPYELPVHESLKRVL